MNVLLTGHGQDRDAVDAARRAVPYDKIILLTTTPKANDLDSLRGNEELAGIRVALHTVDPDDMLGTLNTANRLIEAEKGNHVRVHVAGGPNLVTSALLLASFQQGTTAFFCHERGTSYLPVIRSATFPERFDESERHILLELPPNGSRSHEDVAPKGSTLSAARAAIRALRDAGLVQSDAHTVSLTHTGAYYRAQLATTKAPKAR